MKKENATTITSIIFSFLTTSCCLAPAIFILFGTSAGFLGNLTVLSPLKPFFIGIAFILLGFTFYRLFIKKPDCNCSDFPKTKKIAKIIFLIGVFIFIFAILFEYIILLFV